MLCICSCTKQQPSVFDEAKVLSASQKIQLEQIQKSIFSEYKIIVDVYTTHLPLPDKPPQNLTEFPKVFVFVNDMMKQSRIFVESSASLQLENIQDYISNALIPPFFENGRIGDGIVLSVSFISKTLLSKDYAALDQETPTEYKKELELKVFDATLIHQETPEDAYQSFSYAVFAEHVKVKELYTEDSIEFLEEYPILEFNELKNTLEESKYDIKINGDLCVIFYYADSRRAPFFLRREQNLWKIDWIARSLLIEYDDQKYWHFTDTNNIFMFAFNGYKFDKNGYIYQLTEDDYIVKDDDEPEDTGPKIIYSEQDAQLLEDDEDIQILE